MPPPRSRCFVWRPSGDPWAPSVWCRSGLCPEHEGTEHSERWMKASDTEPVEGKWWFLFMELFWLFNPEIDQIFRCCAINRILENALLTQITTDIQYWSDQFIVLNIAVSQRKWIRFGSWCGSWGQCSPRHSRGSCVAANQIQVSVVFYQITPCRTFHRCL